MTTAIQSIGLGSIFPNPIVESTHGVFRLFDYQRESWLLLVSYPADFTAVCTTELARLVDLMLDFSMRGVRLIATSCDSVGVHRKWASDVGHLCEFEEAGFTKFPFPVVGDEKRELAACLNIIDAKTKDINDLPLACGAAFIIDPVKTVRYMQKYPAGVGRNFRELLRIVDALQLHDTHNFDTPANWTIGGKITMAAYESPSNQSVRFWKSIEPIPLPSGLPYMKISNIKK